MIIPLIIVRCRLPFLLIILRRRLPFLRLIVVLSCCYVHYLHLHVIIVLVLYTMVRVRTFAPICPPFLPCDLFHDLMSFWFQGPICNWDSRSHGLQDPGAHVVGWALEMCTCLT